MFHERFCLPSERQERSLNGTWKPQKPSAGLWKKSTSLHANRAVSITPPAFTNCSLKQTWRWFSLSLYLQVLSTAPPSFQCMKTHVCVSMCPQSPPIKILDLRHLPTLVLYGTDGIPEQRAPVQGVCFVIVSLLLWLEFSLLCSQKNISHVDTETH